MMTVEEPVKASAPPESKAITDGHEDRNPTLTMSDRCDACAAGSERAYVGVTINGTEILLCKHHYEQHELALMPYISDPDSIRDERWQITDAESDRKRTGVSA